MKKFKTILENLEKIEYPRMSAEDKVLAENVHYALLESKKLNPSESYNLRKNNKYLYETYGPKWRTSAGIYSSGIVESCWKGYKKVGYKKKNGRTVPNCVPISEESTPETLYSEVNNVLSNLYVFQFKAHSYHWSITGKDFVQLHSLFGEIYEEVLGSLDRVGEEIRALDLYPVNSLEDIIANSSISSKASGSNENDIVKDLLTSNEVVISSLIKLNESLDESKSYGFSNYISELISSHNKYSWKLKAISK